MCWVVLQMMAREEGQQEGCSVILDTKTNGAQKHAVFGCLNFYFNFYCKLIKKNQNYGLVSRPILVSFLIRTKNCIIS